jgi:hypothetical protein
MSQAAHNETLGPFRIVRTKDGMFSYFAGHHENGQVRWVEASHAAEKPSEEVIRYPTIGMANEVKTVLQTDVSESLNVIRVDE